VISRGKTAVRDIVRSARLASELRWRQPPPLTVARTGRRRPVVHYLAPDTDNSSGGVRNIYRHVDILNAAGIDATVVHNKPGFRCTWFENSTVVASAPEVTLDPRDILVAPECYGPGLHKLPTGVRTVVFNQGAYYTFEYVPLETSTSGAPYSQIPDLIALLVVSQDNAALMRHVFPNTPVHVARPVVDAGVFHPGPRLGERRLAYVPHRRPVEREQLLHILRARGVLDRWELVPISGRTERETADLMRSSAIFLSFSERDGFGLPPAEAMASGCYVVGYTGMGGREFFDPAYCAPVADSDLLAYARTVEDAISVYEADPTGFRGWGMAAAKAISSYYAPDALRDDLLAFHGPLVAALG
jgi:hypothetical protein